VLHGKYNQHNVKIDENRQNWINLLARMTDEE
jgi:hypothetical protein